MSTRGYKVQLQAGIETTASGAGSATTTLNVKDDVFLSDFVGESITVGGSQTTINGVTDANTVELSAAQTWNDGDVVKLDAKTVDGQRALRLRRGAQIIDLTDKGSNLKREIQSGFRDYVIDMSGLYTDSDVSILYLMMAAHVGTKLNFKIDDQQNTGADVSGTGYIASYRISFPYENAVQMDMSIRVTGAITVA